MAAVVTIGTPVPTDPRARAREWGRPVARRPVGQRPVARGSVRASAATFRRRRLVALVLVAAGIVGTARAAVALGGPTPLATPEQPPAATTTYVVRPGDSLWTVATAVAPDTDPRRVVDALEATRDGRPLVPGERITWGG